MKNTLALLAVLSALLVACSSEIDRDYIRGRKWITEDGYKVGGANAIDFSNADFKMQGDTILYHDTAAAIVTGLYKTDNILKVKSIKSGEEGKYLDAVEYTR